MCCAGCIYSCCLPLPPLFFFFCSADLQEEALLKYQSRYSTKAVGISRHSKQSNNLNSNQQTNLALLLATSSRQPQPTTTPPPTHTTLPQPTKKMTSTMPTPQPQLTRTDSSSSFSTADIQEAFAAAASKPRNHLSLKVVQQDETAVPPPSPLHSRPASAWGHRIERK